MRALVIVVALTGVAAAGPRHQGWLLGTDTLPDHGVELETRVSERNDLGEDHLRETALWMGAAVGASERLEVAAIVEATRATANGVAPSFTLARYGGELRYRAGDHVLVRVGLVRDVRIRDLVRVDADVVAALGAGRLELVGQIGGLGEVNLGGTHAELRGGIGATAAAGDELRLGGELYGELSLDSAGERWLALGPTLAWTHGRFWLVATVGIGVANIATAPRVAWGVAF
ncbi:MAG TPA: hypothetical protein VFQ53_22720 [Kofleriaceae bacterium]|nr:hypothetical protein [Kofleriaceae bacterium]